VYPKCYGHSQPTADRFLASERMASNTRASIPVEFGGCRGARHCAVEASYRHRKHLLKRVLVRSQGRQVCSEMLFAPSSTQILSHNWGKYPAACIALKPACTIESSLSFDFCEAVSSPESIRSQRFHILRQRCAIDRAIAVYRFIVRSCAYEVWCNSQSQPSLSGTRQRASVKTRRGKHYL